MKLDSARLDAAVAKMDGYTSLPKWKVTISPPGQAAHIASFVERGSADAYMRQLKEEKPEIAKHAQISRM